MMPPAVTLVCRREFSADCAGIHGVVTAAFGQPDEARLVEALRSGGGLVLSAVAELGGEIVGYIAYSPSLLKPRKEAFLAWHWHRWPSIRPGSAKESVRRSSGGVFMNVGARGTRW